MEEGGGGGGIRNQSLQDQISRRNFVAAEIFTNENRSRQSCQRCTIAENYECSYSKDIIVVNLNNLFLFQICVSRNLQQKHVNSIKIKNNNRLVLSRLATLLKVRI